MTLIKGKVVAVTGAGSGIGRALAKALGARGAHVALADVDEVGLRETADMLKGHLNTQITTHVVDVRSREAVEGYANDVRTQHGGADIIINNAGVAAVGTIEELSYEDLEFVLAVNMWGVIYGTKAFLPLLRERGGGHIVNIGSINSLVPFPRNGPYNMAKFAVLALNETLILELHGQPIHVTGVYPGGVRTSIANRARHVSAREATRFAAAAKTHPDQAARVILQGIEHNRKRVFVGTDSKAMAAARRLAPSFTLAAIGYAARKFYRPDPPPGKA